MAIEDGKAAPAFTLNNAADEKVSLKDYLGQHVIVYFYSRDNTPGCTKEAQGFQQLYKKFKKQNAVIIGISPDDETSHKKFAKKHKLPFVLLSDPDKSVMVQYGAWGEKMMYGRQVIGAIRSTVWVGPDGKVKRHWKRVAKAADHPARVLGKLEADE